MMRAGFRLSFAMIVLGLGCVDAYAQTVLLDEVRTLADPHQPAPVEETFAISNSDTYQVTLTDLGALLTPSAPLGSVELAITSGAAIVGTPLTAAGSAKFKATPGNYGIHVVGVPGSVAGSGPIGITITNATTGDTIATFSDTIALPPSGATPGVASVDATLTVPSSGNYQVTLTDLQLPQTLDNLTSAIAVEGGTLVPNSILLTIPGSPTVTATVALQTGVNYRMFAGGLGASGAAGGLYSIDVTAAGGGSPVFSKTVPIGAVSSVSDVQLTAGAYALSMADLGFPAALTQLGAAVTFNGQAVAQVNAAGSQPFNAVAGTYQTFALGVAPTQGSYSLAVTPGSGAPALSVARGVVSGTAGDYAYGYDATTAAGAYKFTLADFAFPAALTSVQAVAVQGGAVVAGSNLTAVGDANIQAAAGPISVLVFATPAPAGGLFAINVTPQGSDAPVLNTTQGVGQIFSAGKVSIPQDGKYQVVVSDVGFPTTFASLAVMVTRGTTPIGTLTTHGTLPFTATAGNYFVNFVAVPQSGQSAGTYSLQVEPQPPVPTVTIQSSAASVDSNSTVQLTWSSTDATSCTASGGWSGSQSTSGNASSASLTANTTFTLTCTGPGGTASSSVTVNVNTASSSSGKGGGGNVDSVLLYVLAGLLGLQKPLRRLRRSGSPVY